MLESKITEDTVRDWVGERSFRRGGRYFEEGAIVHMSKKGSLLKSWCWGSAPMPYKLWVELGPGYIAAAECSCPVGAGGGCKHVAALLLSWLHQPDSFGEGDPLEKALEQREKADLILLIRQMVARYPDLEEMVDSYPSAAAGSDTKVDAELVRRQVRKVIERADFGHAYYGAAARIASELEAIMQQGALHRERGDWPEAALIYRAVLDELLVHYTAIYDHDGDLNRALWSGSESLGVCLRQVHEPEARLEILRTLVDVVIEDIQVGGYGFADDASKAVLSQATTDEKREVVSWVEEALEGTDPSDEFGSKWQAGAFGGFLLKLQADTLSDEQFIDLCRRSGRFSDLVDRLLSLERVNEAISAAVVASDYDLLALADLFVQHGHESLAEELVWERTATSNDWRLEEWLRKQAAERGDWEKAVHYAESLFWQRPTVEQYQVIQTFAEKLGDWSERREAIFSRLSREGRYEVLTQIQLLEGDVDAALATLPKLRFPGNLPLQVAMKAEETHPLEAIRLYQQRAERLIAARGRPNYAEAARYLIRVRALYRELQDREGWKNYIASVRNQKPRLPALLDELEQAGL